MRRGLFITFEGIEGSGKSTQHCLLVDELERQGAAPVSVCEPGGTDVGERVRLVLLDPDLESMTGETEALLYAASRSQLTAEIIEPALDRGETVVCDRFLDSSIAYQVYGRGLAEEFVRAINASAAGTPPDLTFLILVDPVVGLARATAAGADRIEREALDFHRRVAEGYLAIVAAERGRFRVLDGSLSVGELHEIVRNETEHLMESGLL